MRLRLVTGACLMALLLPAGALSAGEKPEPSRHLRHAFQIFLLLEEKVERLDWDVAQGIGQVVRTEILGLAPELKAAAGDEKVDGFLYEYGRLLKEMESRNREGSLSAYREAEKLLFDIIESFECKAHPVIPILNTEVHEALESARENNLVIAGEEMAEILVYFRTARRVLAEEGLPADEIEALASAIDRAAEGLADGDAEAAGEALADAAARTEKLVSR